MLLALRNLGVAWPHMCSQNGAENANASAGSQCVKRKRDHQRGNALKLAAYTYTIGHRSALSTKKLVPDCHMEMGVDCFYYCEVPDRNSVWAKSGWRLRPIELLKGTEFVSASRLTAKYYKFVLPKELQGYDWVLSFDDNYHVELGGLAELVRSYSQSVFVLLNWRHWMRDELGRKRYILADKYNGFAAFELEANEMLSWRSGYIGASYENSVAWLEKMRTLKASKAAPGLFSSYFDLSILIQHVSHPLWSSEARRVLINTFQQSHSIERDQFLLPYYLWLSPQVFNATAIVREPVLFQTLCRCAVFGERVRSTPSADEYDCVQNHNWIGPCLGNVRCPTFERSLTACQKACTELPGCRRVVFNRYHQCFMKGPNSKLVLERLKKHGTGQAMPYTRPSLAVIPHAHVRCYLSPCVFGLDPCVRLTVGCVRKSSVRTARVIRKGAVAGSHMASEQYRAYEQLQASKLPTIFGRVQEWDRTFERQLLARLWRQRHLIASPVLCVGAQLGGEVRAFRAVRPGLLSIGIDFNPGPRNAAVMWGDAHSFEFTNETFGSVYTVYFALRTPSAHLLSTH